MSEPASDEMVLAMMAYIAVHVGSDEAVAVAHVLSRAEYWPGGRRFAVLSIGSGWRLFDLDEDTDGSVEARAALVVP